MRDWGDGVQVQPGQVVLLENCRMNVGEGKDDEALSKKYAALCDVFVMDAFGTAHRAQASTHGVIKFAKQAAGGPLLMAELDALDKALANPARPLLAIVAAQVKAFSLHRVQDSADGVRAHFLLLLFFPPLLLSFFLLPSPSFFFAFLLLFPFLNVVLLKIGRNVYTQIFKNGSTENVQFQDLYQLHLKN